MARVFVAIGSNIEPARNVRAAVLALRETYGRLDMSPVYRTPAQGFKGDDFYNLVVAFDSERSAREITERLAAIEAQQGRVRLENRFSSRTLDLDLLLYGDEVMEADGMKLPHDDIARYAFVLRPLAELAPTRRHPSTGKSFQAMWRDFPDKRAEMRTVELVFD